MMYVISLGLVNVASAGTPTKLADVLSNLGLPADLKVYCIRGWQHVGQTHSMYVGLSDTAPDGKNDGGTTGAVFVASTGVGLIKEVIAPPTTGHADHFEVCAPTQINAVRVADYAIDAANNNDKMVIYCEVL